MTWGSERTFIGLIVLGVAIRLTLAIFATNSTDLEAFGFVVQQGAAGHALYGYPGFTYPPLVGYVWIAAGKLFGTLALPIAIHASSLAPYRVPGTVSYELTTPLAALFIKIPALISDALLARVVYGACERMGAVPDARRIAVLLIWLNPIVIFDSSVQASWDSIVPASMVCAVLFAIVGDAATASAWMTAGIFAKMVPIVGAPLVAVALAKGRRDDVVRRIVTAALVAIGVAGLCLVPVAAWGELSNMRTAMATHASADFGGFNVWAALDLNALRPIAEWMTRERGRVSTILEVLQWSALLVLAAAAWRGPALTPARSLLFIVMTLAIVLLAFPYAQPGYAVWIIPPCVILGSAGPRRWTSMALVLSAVAFVFAASVRAPSAVVMPACWFFHFCDATAFAKSAFAYGYAPGLLTSLAQLDIDSLLGIAGTGVLAAILLCAVADWRGARVA